MKNINEFNDYLSNKKIAVIGYGVSNKPLINYLININSDITLFDKKELDELDDDIKKLISDKKIKVSLGDKYLEKLNNFDIIFRSPSFLITNKYLEKEKNRGALITTEVEQVIKYAPGKVIGVTGSKGKTTTTTIIYNILKELGYNVYLGGNIGIPLFDKIKDMNKDDIIVLELSSFQLMGMSVSPDISVVTNISPDHLDIHKDYQEYIDSKKEIFLNQNKNNLLILNKDDDIVSKFSEYAIGDVKYFSSNFIKDSYCLNDDDIVYNEEKIIDTNKLILKGKHNYLNICAALSAIDIFIKDRSVLENIVMNIKGVEHRLEFVREINGVKWYNDSASTTPDKSIAGITSFKEKVVLIAGGYDKNISYDTMAEPIIKNVSKLILFGDTKNKIYDAVMALKSNTSNLEIYVMDTLEEVVYAAYKLSIPGEVVLFSPASASFDMFKNAYQRGDKFKELVEKLDKS